ncbi:RidA family protein [Cytophagaceae bacterium DM2B3-1]|uniref:RidA family protein n=2 Tax=Xanthocytophaga TaxID=3078918 RepID=A0ABT7CWX1_9BACT|nr:MULTISPECIES: RidA family protein [Xanthocytophaga]MDJ1470701.1 RidA family protein [Xanthocytophaga flavus]MDJ1498270.1 RidA family protein [Xanthocytophaga flavus]MDJ1505285.1 RidA family protein [Xanthocytophaga agilis]
MITVIKVILLVFTTFVFYPSFAQVSNRTKPAFSSYVVQNGLVFVSGQIGLSHKKELPNSNFSLEVRQSIENVESVLKEAGLTLEQVVSTTVYLTDIKQYEEFNKVYQQYFHAPFPARTCIAVKELVMGASVEISVVASEKNK